MMTFYIIHRCDNKPLQELCFNCGSAYSMIVPHIGETFIHMPTNTEYEVIDVIRIFRREDEYGIQVELKKREKRKYQ